MFPGRRSTYLMVADEHTGRGDYRLQGAVAMLAIE